jgi:hypothetical protein
MTITLDYTDLQPDDPAEVLAAGALELQHELLFAELVFRVDAADFTSDEHTTLLDAAAILHGRVTHLTDGATSRYESPVSGDTIDFARAGDQVTISAGFTDAVATADLAELTAAVTAFHERVSRDLLARYPGLAGNPAARAQLAEGALAGD